MFEEELKLIRNPKTRDELKLCIDAIPEYFTTIPASSTGKYHPNYATGDGGLYRHVRAAVRIGEDLSNLAMFELTDDEHDAVIFALVMHDSCKSGVIKERYTRFDHPLLASVLVRNTLENSDTPDRVCPLIECHMGQWNTDRYHPGITLPVPHLENKLELLVHLADYLASRKYLEVTFDTNNWFTDIRQYESKLDENLK